MPALELKVSADYLVHESFSVETQDHEDHTFCGIAFDIEVKDRLPLDFLLIESLSVRGLLGELTVWTTSKAVPFEDSICDSSLWTKAYHSFHEPSPTALVELELERPLKLLAGEIRGIYVHCRGNGDQGIVYDDQRSECTHSDVFIRVLPGCAHLSHEPFDPVPIWGWGSAWRSQREFVGRISFSCKYLLWRPSEHLRFPPGFRRSAAAFFEMHAYSWDSLPADIVIYVLNMCPWDWFEEPESTSTCIHQIKEESTAPRRRTVRANGGKGRYGDSSVWRAFHLATSIFLTPSILMALFAFVVFLFDRED